MGNCISGDIAMQDVEIVTDKPLTYFAPPEREDAAKLTKLSRCVLDNAMIQLMLRASQGHILVLNQYRQILAADEKLLRTLCEKEPLGLRPGELLNCCHAKQGPCGCGTSKSCRNCGMVLTILASQVSGRMEEGECKLRMVDEGGNSSAEFKIRCTPMTLSDEPLTITVLQDISSVKRREVLERFFIHDLRNILQGLSGYCELLRCGEVETSSEKILALSNQLSEEIDGQSCLMGAEYGTLNTRRQQLDAGAILRQIEAVFEEHPASRGKTLHTLVAHQDIMFNSDNRLLMRVLINMTVNAFEATPKGGTVRVSFDRNDGIPVFKVWNETVIPEDTALQIFHRSFTTKNESGRGVGTYSMKLLGENYLNGIVSFSTSEEKGTEFQIQLPA